MIVEILCYHNNNNNHNNNNSYNSENNSNISNSSQNNNYYYNNFKCVNEKFRFSQNFWKFCISNLFLHFPIHFYSILMINIFYWILLGNFVCRSMSTDILFGLVKAASSLRPTLRVVITSATLDANKLSGFFYVEVLMSWYVSYCILFYGII